MTYPIMQRELTVHLHSSNWYRHPIEDTEKFLGPDDYDWHRCNLDPDSFTFGEGMLAKQGMYANFYMTGFQE